MRTTDACNLYIYIYIDYTHIDDEYIGGDYIII